MVSVQSFILNKTKYVACYYNMQTITVTAFTSTTLTIFNGSSTSTFTAPMGTTVVGLCINYDSGFFDAALSTGVCAAMSSPITILLSTCYTFNFSTSVSIPSTFTFSIIDLSMVKDTRTATVNSDVFYLDTGFIGNTKFSAGPCCVHPDTTVMTPNGLIPIKSLKTGDKVIGFNGVPIKIEYNIKYIPTREYVKISKGALGSDLPSTDLLIRRGHPILLEGKETNCSDLINGNSICDIILDEPEHVWSLCTENRTFVMMNGIPVCTWSEIGWKNFTKNDNTGRQVLWWKQ